ncbi:MAG: TetR/AcrR family transcriptional regulator [Bacteroidota bacterium]
MGRKATQKPRKHNQAKTSQWLPVLFAALQETGLEGLTMDDFARLLGKSKTTLYTYYQTKEALLGDALRYKLSEVAAFLPLLGDPQQPYAKRYIQAVGAAVAAMNGIDARFLGDLQRFYPTLWAELEAFQTQAVEALAAFYRAGIEAGAFNTLSPELLSESDRYFFRLMTRQDWLQAQGMTVQAAFDAYLRMKFEGLRAS